MVKVTFALGEQTSKLVDEIKNGYDFAWLLVITRTDSRFCGIISEGVQTAMVTVPSAF